MISNSPHCPLTCFPHRWCQTPVSLFCLSESFLERRKGRFKCAFEAPAILAPISLLQPEETLITPRGGG